jgi:uncharacterized membrane-anchored protein
MRCPAPVRGLLAAVLAAAALFAAPAAEERPGNAPAEENPADKLPWQAGPGAAVLGGRARLNFPAEFRFVGDGDARSLLEMAGNPTSGDELGVLEHRRDEWWVVFEFDEVGYVKDDEKADLNADKLLASIRRGTEQGNRHRRQGGLPEMTILGWHTPPSYNDQTKNLEWAILAESNGEKFVNHNVRVLGRKGVMVVTLVEDLAQLDATLPKFRALLADFGYQQGESYAEYRPGDTVAKFGLGALVVGGGAAAAAKLGLFGALAAFFKKGWKLVVVALVALGAGIRRLALGGGRRRNGEQPNA